MEPKRYLIQDARPAAIDIVRRLEPYCEPGRILVCGSYRRQTATVHDLDIVLIPKFMLATQVTAICCGTQKPLTMGGGKISGGDIIKHFDYHDSEKKTPHWTIPIDIYFATPENWGTLVLIRTGSKENNRRLCSRAIELGLKLHADGGGLTDAEGVVIADDEVSIYQKLGLEYQEPQYRNTGRP